MVQREILGGLDTLLCPLPHQSLTTLARPPPPPPPPPPPRETPLSQRLTHLRYQATYQCISLFTCGYETKMFINSRPHLLSRLLLRSYFLRLEEEYWRNPFFLINFIGVIFKAGNETREKIWSGFCAEQN